MWSIALLENTVEVNKKAIPALFKSGVGHSIWYDKDDVLDDNNNLSFNSDHMEHMDYLWREDIQKILKKYKAKGRALFCDVEGDSFGKFWGYEFDGKGGFKELEGQVVWNTK